MNHARPLPQWCELCPQEWLALEVIGKTPSGEPLCALLAHHRDEQELFRLLRTRGVEQVYVVYAEAGRARREYVALFNTGQ